MGETDFEVLVTFMTLVVLKALMASQNRDANIDLMDLDLDLNLDVDVDHLVYWADHYHSHVVLMALVFSVDEMNSVDADVMELKEGFV